MRSATFERRSGEERLAGVGPRLLPLPPSFPQRKPLRMLSAFAASPAKSFRTRVRFLRTAGDKRGRDWNDASRSQDTPRTAGKPEAKKRHGTEFHEPSERAWPRGHPNFGLPAFRTVRPHVSVSNPAVCGPLLQQLQDRSTSRICATVRIYYAHYNTYIEVLKNV